MKKKSAPAATPVGDLLKGVVARIAEEKKELSQEDVAGAWCEAAGERGGKHGKPVSLHRKVLRIRVDSSAWLQQFALNKRKILKKLQTHFGKDKITDIHFRIGEPEA